MDFILYLMCCISQIIIMSIGENWRNFLKFYNTDFVLVKGIPAFKGNLPTTVSATVDALNELNPCSYQNIFEVLKIIAVLPSTSGSCERSISSLRRLKDYT